MKICFFGTPEIAVGSLEKLAQNSDFKIVGIGVFPDRKVGRKKILTPCAVKKSAQDLNLPIFELENKKDLINLYETLNFDIAIVIAFGMIFPEKILNIPKFGTVNVHFSLLPEYRGASPVQSAILDGKKVSGITFQQMVKKLDAGDILFQKESNIEHQNTLQLWDFFAKQTAQELPEFLKNIQQKKNSAKKQNPEKISFCGKFEKSDGEIFPDKENALKIYQKFLAFTPWPGIFLRTSKGNMKILDLEIIEEKKNHENLLKCSEKSFIKIKKAQIPGKKPMDFKIILQGNPDILEEIK